MIWILVLFCLITSVTLALAMHDNAGTSWGANCSACSRKEPLALDSSTFNI